MLPYVISCNIPETKKNLIPSSVSLIEDECEIVSNHLTVIYETKKMEKKIAVCTKGHTFPKHDMSIKLMEWIEVNNALGAKPILYYFHNHPNILKVVWDAFKKMFV